MGTMTRDRRPGGEADRNVCPTESGRVAHRFTTDSRLPLAEYKNVIRPLRITGIGGGL